MKKGQLFQGFELLEGESIIWQGGSSLKGIAYEALRILAMFFGLILLLLIFALTIPKVIIDDADNENANNVEEASHPHESLKQKDGKKLMTEQEVSESLIHAFRPYWYTLLALLLFMGIYQYFMIKNYYMVVTNERICIQSGALDTKIAFIDIDKIVSVLSTQPFLAKYFNFHHLEIIHAGVSGNTWQRPYSFSNPYKIHYVDIDKGLPSKLLLNWLPRDNHQR